MPNAVPLHEEEGDSEFSGIFLVCEFDCLSCDCYFRGECLGDVEAGGGRKNEMWTFEHPPDAPHLVR